MTADNDAAAGGCAAKTGDRGPTYTVNFAATAAAGAPYKLIDRHHAAKAT